MISKIFQIHCNSGVVEPK